MFGISPLFHDGLFVFVLFFVFNFEGFWRRFDFVCVNCFFFFYWVGSFVCPLVWAFYFVLFGWLLGFCWLVCLFVLQRLFSASPNALLRLPVLELHWRS